MLSQSLTALRLVAILPLCLLCAFWIYGEIALTGAAIGVPVLAGILGNRGGMAASGRRPAAVPELLSRDGLEEWLRFVMPARGQAKGHSAVMTVKIDDLDAIESRLGRDLRRSVRHEAMARLRTLMRQYDVVAELDNQFIAFGLRDVKAPQTENLLQLARRLQAACDEPFASQSARVYCTMSVGIATEVQLADPTPGNLLRAAETAGEFASTSGPGSVRVYSDGLTSEKEDTRARARALSNALETGEIFAWFQPQMSSDGYRVVGFEALARWEHPEQGVLLPGAFLPDIQGAGLSQRLAEVILKQALTALNAWDAAGYRVPCVSVNFSSEELRNPRLADYVLWELDRFNLAPGRLVIEVLESVIAESHEDAISRTLKALSAAGCRIDLDDFGTGFSSIINIRRFNVSRIKIDRRLVASLDKDADQRRMVSALLSFSAKLGIEALAEGVETERERDMLLHLGCSLIQGYVAARPMPLGETLLWLDGMPQVDAGAEDMSVSA